MKQNYQEIPFKEKKMLAKIKFWPFSFNNDILFVGFFLPSFANKLGDFVLALLSRFVFAQRTGNPSPWLTARFRRVGGEGDGKQFPLNLHYQNKKLQNCILET